MNQHAKFHRMQGIALGAFPVQRFQRVRTVTWYPGASGSTFFLLDTPGGPVPLAPNQPIVWLWPDADLIVHGYSCDGVLPLLNNVYIGMDPEGGAK